MLLRGSSQCIFCQVLRCSALAVKGSSRQLRHKSSPQRGFASLSTWQKSSSRYDLSSSVAVPKLSKDRKLRLRAQNDPFPGMNRTHFVPPIKSPSVKRAPAQARPERWRMEVAKKRNAKKNSREEGNFHALKMQQTLVDIGYGRRSATKERIGDVDSFDNFGLSISVQEAISQNALKDLDVVKPTPIQRLAIPALLGEDRRRRRQSSNTVTVKVDQKQFLLAAETGSGKTLAYILPAVDAIKKAELVQQEQQQASGEAIPEISSTKSLELFDIQELEAEEALKRSGRPEVVILVPTAELVDQIGAVAKSLSHHVKFRSALISSAYSSTVIRNRLFNEKGIDVLIATPTLLNNIVKSSPSIMSRVSHLIIDEADSLLDKSFEDDTGDIIERAMPSLTHLVMCSATIPKRMDNYLRKKYPDMTRLTTPNLHAIPRRVQLSVVDVTKGSYFENKNLACADTIWNIGKQHRETSAEEETPLSGLRRIIVFVNEREKASEVAAYLQAQGIDAVAFSRDLESRQQSNLIAEFTGSSNLEGAMSDEWQRMDLPRKLDQTRVLVTTDLASRGIDTTPVREVILYDVPQSTIDFIHRLGRTGRMGRRGRAIVLVGRHDRRDVVSEVKHSMFRGQALI